MMSLRGCRHEIIMKTRCLVLCALGVLVVNCSVLAQPQQAWVNRYNGGFTNKTHTPLAMKLDSAGNIYVGGSSQNASNFYDYVVLKYAANGTQLYVSRYSSNNGVNFTVTGFTLDAAGNAYATGTGGTVKFDITGAVAWAAPYNGNDLAADTNGNVYVTGFSTTQYATAKLNSQGSNVWMRTYVYVTSPGSPVAVSQKVAVNNVGNIYVAGWANTIPYYFFGQLNYYSDPIMLMYDSSGNTLRTTVGYFGNHTWGTTVGLITDNKTNVYVVGATADADVAKVNSIGQTEWIQYVGSPPPPVNGTILDANGNVYVAGGAYLGVKLASTNGQVVWGVDQYLTSFASGNGIALDNVTNVYVVANSTTSGFATLKYDSNGNQQWVIRYNGPANGNDGATAIAVASDGSIYVTGYSANTNGGSDITTIKYGNITNLQKKSDGSIQLQFFGNPGQSYHFKATTDFLSWTNLGSSLADTNGVFYFLDTNAPLFPYRFYRWYY